MPQPSSRLSKSFALKQFAHHVGKLKALVGDAAERLQLSVEEVMKMSLVEIDALLEGKERELEQSNADIQEQINELGWDVDVDEDGPFICIAEE